jgi:hypothetical protein
MSASQQIRHSSPRHVEYLFDTINPRNLDSGDQANVKKVASFSEKECSAPSPSEEATPSLLISEPSGLAGNTSAASAIAFSIATLISSVKDFSVSDFDSGSSPGAAVLGSSFGSELSLKPNA